MDYETFEPDENDPWYDMMCRAAYTQMFSGGKCERIVDDNPTLSVLPAAHYERRDVRRAAHKVKKDANIR